MITVKQNKILIVSLYVFLLLICTLGSSVAKKFEPVKWIFEVNKLSDCEYELLFQGKIDKNWHLYALKSYGKNGPMPIAFVFYKNENYKLLGRIVQSECLKEFVPLWEFRVQFFKHQAEFKQKVKITGNTPLVIKGQIEYMVGNGNQCLPPYRVDFEFEVPGANGCLCNRNSSKTSSPCDSTNLSQFTELNELKYARHDSIALEKKAPVSELEPDETRSWWLFFLLGF